MRTLSHRGLLALAGALALTAWLAGGCSRNDAATRLIPTGLRPAPTEGSAALTGRIVYDPSAAPDLDTPPYPSTIVDLYKDGVKVASDTLASDLRTFAFTGLTAGSYVPLARAHFFLAGSIPAVRLTDRPVDAGDLTLPLDPSAAAFSLHLRVDGNASFDFPDTMTMALERAGLWIGPDVDLGFGMPADTAIVLTAGVHRLRFVTDYAIDLPSDYGGDGVTVVDAPFDFQPARLTSGANTDLQVRIPTTGRYRVTLDERRLTFGVTRVTGPVPVLSRRSVR